METDNRSHLSAPRKIQVKSSDQHLQPRRLTLGLGQQTPDIFTDLIINACEKIMHCCWHACLAAGL